MSLTTRVENLSNFLLASPPLNVKRVANGLERRGFAFEGRDMWDAYGRIFESYVVGLLKNNEDFNILSDNHADVINGQRLNNLIYLIMSDAGYLGYNPLNDGIVTVAYDGQETELDAFAWGENKSQAIDFEVKSSDKDMIDFMANGFRWREKLIKGCTGAEPVTVLIGPRNAEKFIVKTSVKDIASDFRHEGNYILYANATDNTRKRFKTWWGRNGFSAAATNPEPPYVNRTTGTNPAFCGY